MSRTRTEDTPSVPREVVVAHPSVQSTHQKRMSWAGLLPRRHDSVQREQRLQCPMPAFQSIGGTNDMTAWLVRLPRSSIGNANVIPVWVNEPKVP
jgi:hypothetical protein